MPGAALALDTRFLQLMLRHHEGGSGMLIYAAQYASIPDVRNLASRMLTGPVAHRAPRPGHVLMRLPADAAVRSSLRWCDTGNVAELCPPDPTPQRVLPTVSRVIDLHPRVPSEPPSHGASSLSCRWAERSSTSGAASA